jgi:LEA14-like dessication related protein
VSVGKSQTTIDVTLRRGARDTYYVIHLRNGESMTVNWYKRTTSGILIPLHHLGEVEIADIEIDRIEARPLLD